MALTLEEKENYVSIIDSIWSGSMNNNTVDNISDEVADDVVSVLSEIRACTKNIQSLFDKLVAIFSEIYVGDVAWKILIKTKAMSSNEQERYYVRGWLDELKKEEAPSATYPASLACVLSAAVNWKSSVQLKLMGF